VSTAAFLSSYRLYPPDRPHHRETAPGVGRCGQPVPLLHSMQPEQGTQHRVDRPETGLLVALYHPRYSAWQEHFSVTADGIIKGLTAEGPATVLVLAMNEEDRVRLRALLIRRGKYS